LCLPTAVILQALRQGRVAYRENRRGEQGGVLGAGLADRECGDWMPAGICTIDSSESTPFRMLLFTGTPSTGSASWRAHPRQVRRAAGPGDDHRDAPARGGLGVLEQQVRRAVRTDDSDFVRDTSSPRIAAACRIVSKSDLLPMITPTRGEAREAMRWSVAEGTDVGQYGGRIRFLPLRGS
jgi:hypothetical protein